MDPDRIDPRDGAIASDEAEWLGRAVEFGPDTYVQRGTLAALR
jgi:hypothetical protein